MIVRDYADVSRQTENLRWYIFGESTYDGIEYYNVRLCKSNKVRMIRCSDYNSDRYNMCIPTFRIESDHERLNTRMHHSYVDKIGVRIRKLLAENGGWMSASEIGRCVGESAGTTAGYLRYFDGIEMKSTSNRRVYRIVPTEAEQ